jgi:alpha-1,3-rhamnosyl/mannosyltransferase
MLLPRIDEIDKPAFYRGALAFCFPSLYEGFGLTPLEALASGTPVLCSNATSLPEVAGSAAWLLPPHDPVAWSAALVKLADDDELRSDLALRGPEQARRFSWRRCAEETANVYRGVLGL